MPASFIARPLSSPTLPLPPSLSLQSLRRAIEPCRGKWTVPAGFMELNETSSEGEVRETREEAEAAVRVDAPYAYWDIPAIGQVRQYN